jgi:putative endonuclease
MDEFVVYILYSEKFNKNYTGYTSNLIARFRLHNLLETKGFTLKFRPWKVIHVEFFHSKSEAMKREKHLKTGIGREFIQKLIRGFLSAAADIDPKC